MAASWINIKLRRILMSTFLITSAIFKYISSNFFQEILERVSDLFHLQKFPKWKYRDLKHDLMIPVRKVEKSIIITVIIIINNNNIIIKYHFKYVV